MDNSELRISRTPLITGTTLNLPTAIESELNNPVFRKSDTSINNAGKNLPISNDCLDRRKKSNQGTLTSKLLQGKITPKQLYSYLEDAKTSLQLDTKLGSLKSQQTKKNNFLSVGEMETLRREEKIDPAVSLLLKSADSLTIPVIESKLSKTLPGTSNTILELHPVLSTSDTTLSFKPADTHEAGSDIKKDKRESSSIAKVTIGNVPLAGRLITNKGTFTTCELSVKSPPSSADQLHSSSKELLSAADEMLSKVERFEEKKKIPSKKPKTKILGIPQTNILRLDYPTTGLNAISPQITKHDSQQRIPQILTKDQHTQTPKTGIPTATYTDKMSKDGSIQRTDTIRKDNQNLKPVIPVGKLPYQITSVEFPLQIQTGKLPYHTPASGVPRQIPSDELTLQIPTNKIAIQIPADEQASLIPAGVLPSQIPAGEVPRPIPAGEVPRQIPAGEVTSQIPAGEVTSQIPAGEVPCQIPPGEVVSQIPVGEIQSQIPAVEIPIQIPADEIPIQIPAGEVTSQIPAGEVTSQIPAGEVTSQIPAGEVTSQIPAGEVTSQIPAGEVPSQIPAGEVTSQIPAGEVPSQIPAGEVTSQIPAGEVPSQIPAGEVTSQIPAGEVTSQIPAGEVPSQIPAGEVPSQTPAGEVPSQIPAGEVTSQIPAGEVPIQIPAGQVPSQIPAGGIPSQIPAGQVPTQIPAGEVPSQIPAGEIPTQIPAGQVPTQIPAGEVPSQIPAGEIPTQIPAGGLSTQIPSDQVPIQIPAGEVPSQIPAGGLPSQIPAGGIPSQIPAGQVPSQIPAGGLPSQIPAGEVLSQIPAGEVPGQIPSGQVPSQIPAGGLPSQIPAGGIPSQIPAGQVPSQIPAGGLPSQIPAGGIPSQIPAGEVLSQIPAGEVPSQIPAGGLPSQIPAGEVLSQIPAGEVPGQIPAGQVPSQIPAGGLPSQIPVDDLPSQIPAGEVPGQIPAGELSNQVPVCEPAHRIPDDEPAHRIPFRLISSNCETQTPWTYVELEDQKSVGELPDQTPAGELIDRTSADELVDQTPADKVSDQTPADKVSEQTPADKVSDQTPADELVDQTPADKVSEQTPADKVSDQTPADELVDQTPADKVSEQTPADKVSDQTPADKVSDQTPAGKLTHRITKNGPKQRNDSMQKGKQISRPGISASKSAHQMPPGQIARQITKDLSLQRSRGSRPNNQNLPSRNLSRQSTKDRPIERKISERGGVHPIPEKIAKTMTPIKVTDFTDEIEQFKQFLKTPSLPPEELTKNLMQQRPTFERSAFSKKKQHSLTDHQPEKTESNMKTQNTQNKYQELKVTGKEWSNHHDFDPIITKEDDHLFIKPDDAIENVILDEEKVCSDTLDIIFDNYEQHNQISEEVPTQDLESFIENAKENFQDYFSERHDSTGDLMKYVTFSLKDQDKISKEQAMLLMKQALVDPQLAELLKTGKKEDFLAKLKLTQLVSSLKEDDTAHPDKEADVVPGEGEKLNETADEKSGLVKDVDASKDEHTKVKGEAIEDEKIPVTDKIAAVPKDVIAEEPAVMKAAEVKKLGKPDSAIPGKLSIPTEKSEDISSVNKVLKEDVDKPKEASATRAALDLAISKDSPVDSTSKVHGDDNDTGTTNLAEGTTKGATTKGGTTKGATTEGSTAKGATTEGGTAKGGTTEGGTAKGGTTEGGTAKGGTTEGGTKKGGTTEGGTTKGGTTEGGTTVPKEGSPTVITDSPPTDIIDSPPKVIMDSPPTVSMKDLSTIPTEAVPPILPKEGLPTEDKPLKYITPPEKEISAASKLDKPIEKYAHFERKKSSAGKVKPKLSVPPLKKTLSKEEIAVVDELLTKQDPSTEKDHSLGSASTIGPASDAIATEGSLMKGKLTDSVSSHSGEGLTTEDALSKKYGLDESSIDPVPSEEPKGKLKGKRLSQANQGKIKKRKSDLEEKKPLPDIGASKKMEKSESKILKKKVSDSKTDLNKQAAKEEKKNLLMRKSKRKLTDDSKLKSLFKDQDAKEDFIQMGLEKILSMAKDSKYQGLKEYDLTKKQFKDPIEVRDTLHKRREQVNHLIMGMSDEKGMELESMMQSQHELFDELETYEDEEINETLSLLTKVLHLDLEDKSPEEHEVVEPEIQKKEKDILQVKEAEQLAVVEEEEKESIQTPEEKEEIKFEEPKKIPSKAEVELALPAPSQEALDESLFQNALLKMKTLNIFNAIKALGITNPQMKDFDDYIAQNRITEFMDPEEIQHLRKAASEMFVFKGKSKSKGRKKSLRSSSTIKAKDVKNVRSLSENQMTSKIELEVAEAVVDVERLQKQAALTNMKQELEMLSFEQEITEPYIFSYYVHWPEPPKTQNKPAKKK